jgi:hypothetical protein
MKVAALVLSAFGSLSSSLTGPSASFPPSTALESSEGRLLFAPDDSDDGILPEASAADEVSYDLPFDAEPGSRYLFVGCELALATNVVPDAWARDPWVGAPRPLLVDNGHREKGGHWLDYEQIPRRPDRPKSYEAYLYPLADAPVVSGYDLDKPDDEQRRGRMNAVGHGGVDLVAKIGTPIEMLRLEHQVGEAEVLYVGPLYGETVVTRHVVHEGGADRDYVLLFGHLDRVADDVRRGRRLREGDTIGFVGNSASPAFVHLHLEARRVRDRTDTWSLPGVLLAAREYTVVTDPRNVLPLRTPRLPSPRCVPRLTSEPRRYWLGTSWALRLE